MRQFLEWVDSQDPESRKSGRGLGTWAGIAVLGAALISLAAFVPVSRELFQLTPGPPAVMLGALVLVAIPLALYEQRRDLPHRVLVGIELTFALAMELFAALLVTYSELPGAAAFAGVSLFTTTWYGFVFRVTTRVPWHALGSGLVFAVAAALNPNDAHLAMFAVMGPVAMCTKVLVGSMAEKTDRFRAEREQLRAAIDAQILDDQAHRIAELADTLLDLVSRNHDVRNAVMAASVGAETLQMLAEHDAIDDKRHTIDEIAKNLEGSLDRVRLLLNEISTLGRNHLTEIAPEHVRVRPIVERLVSDVQRRFPQLHVALDELAPETTVRVAGGEVTLARIVENALVNACEGNGKEHARHVRVRVESEASGPYVRVRVQDDGPGFAPELIDGPVRGFFTTKDTGTGLGLYTLERLARASGGRVGRENDGGALLTIELLRADRADEATA